MVTAIRGVIFDKDGTLFDFHASWGEWAGALITELTDGDAGHAERLAGAVQYDMSARRFAPESPVIAGSPDEIVALMAPYLPRLTRAQLRRRIDASAAAAAMVPAVPLAPLLARLRGDGLRIGVATNDAEAPARAHLGALAAQFDFIAGFDTGYGAKPGPGMLLAFARACGLAPGSVLMVGDTPHDLLAGRAAGMRTAGVLTGPVGRGDLVAHADAVLDDIGAVPGLLARWNRTGR